MQGVFTAGDGDLSIVYQAGAHVWGAWNVNYAEGIEPEDFEADRSLGYVGDTGDAGDELAARMWIRSDVSIDQDNQSSTLPAVFRDAHERMSGDVVVERTISGLGLGGLVPYVDFHHGDEIGTVIGSKVVPLPANGIEFSTDPDGGQDYEVHVGKGLLGNREERDLRNAQLEAQIFSEIAERKREQARLAEQQERDRKLAEKAQAAADKADSAASRANTNASRLRSNQNELKRWAEAINGTDEQIGHISTALGDIAYMFSTLDYVLLDLIAGNTESADRSRVSLSQYVDRDFNQTRREIGISYPSRLSWISNWD